MLYIHFPQNLQMHVHLYLFPSSSFNFCFLFVYKPCTRESNKSRDCAMIAQSLFDGVVRWFKIIKEGFSIFIYKKQEEILQGSWVVATPLEGYNTQYNIAEVGLQHNRSQGLCKLNRAWDESVLYLEWLLIEGDPGLSQYPLQSLEVFPCLWSIPQWKSQWGQSYKP